MKFHKLILFFFSVMALFFSMPSYAYDCTGLSVWGSSSIYTGGKQAQHNNVAYKAKWWTQNENPATNSGEWGVWSSLGHCDGSSNQSPVAEVNGPYSGSEGVAITFSSAGSNDPDGSIATYHWNFGDNNSSTSSNPSHAYTTAGTYTVTLTVTDNGGLSANSSTTAVITGTPPPTGNCTSPQYSAGTQYTKDQVVQNAGKEYRCNVPGWCSSTATWAYEPGVGAHWADAWTELSSCEGPMGNLKPVSNANGPYSSKINTVIAFSSAGSNDPDGTIAAYLWDFGDGTSSNVANPSHSYTASGFYTVTLTVTDNKAATATSSTTANIGDTTNSTLPHRILVGYWHNFDNGSGYIKMKDVATAWDIINVAFAENKRNGAAGEVSLDLCTQCANGETVADFTAGVRLQQSRGKKVLISLGGANAHIQLSTTAARDNFVRTMGDIIAQYGFDGIDIDLEGGSLSMAAGDTIANPKTPVIVNMISAIRSLKARFGPSFVLTMAPETAYVQGGYNTFSGIWGAYLPLIHALRNDLTVLHVQHYNTGSLTATDGNIYQPATADFHVSMSDMMITGFAAPAGSSNLFPGLRPDQVAIGLPSGASSASSGYTSPATVQVALDCLIKVINCGSYKPAQGHADFRGLMTWSINWDKFRGSEFSTPHRNYLNQNP